MITKTVSLLLAQMKMRWINGFHSMRWIPFWIEQRKSANLADCCGKRFENVLFSSSDDETDDHLPPMQESPENPYRKYGQGESLSLFLMVKGEAIVLCYHERN